MRRVTPRKQSRMPRCRLGDCMRLPGIRENGTPRQHSRKRTPPLRPVALQVVAPELINRDQDDQMGRRRQCPLRRQQPKEEAQDGKLPDQCIAGGNSQGILRC